MGTPAWGVELIGPTLWSVGRGFGGLGDPHIYIYICIHIYIYIYICIPIYLFITYLWFIPCLFLFFIMCILCTGNLHLSPCLSVQETNWPRVGLMRTKCTFGPKDLRAGFIRPTPSSLHPS